MIIAKGKLVASDTPENLENLMSGTGHVELEAKTSMEKAKAILKGIPLISKAEYREETKESVTVRIESEGQSDIREQLFFAFAKEGIPLLTLRLNKSTLEDIFLELTQGDRAQEDETKEDEGQGSNTAESQDFRENIEDRKEEETDAVSYTHLDVYKRQELPIHSLGELTQEEFELHKEAIKDPIRQRRAKHAVYENQRTIRAVEALRENDVELFGRLMNESHQSLKEDYQVSCREIDILVDMACLLYTSRCV